MKNNNIGLLLVEILVFTVIIASTCMTESMVAEAPVAYEQDLTEGFVDFEFDADYIDLATKLDDVRYSGGWLVGQMVREIEGTHATSNVYINWQTETYYEELVSIN